MKLTEAIEGYMIDKMAGGYSPRTLRLYKYIFENLHKFLDDPPVEDITLRDLQRFMIYLQDGYVPRRFGGDTRPISRAHIDNHWKAIRSLFGFCNETFELKRPDLKLKRPEKPKPLVLPYSEKEWADLMKACDYSTQVQPADRKSYRIRRPTAQRDRALLLLMVDTGLRVGEICRLEIQDCNQQTGEIQIAPFGAGKKSRPRTVYLGRNARRELWLYLAKRKDYKNDDPLFELTPNGVRSLMNRLAAASGVKNVHPHRFRHTFAIEYLRNGGDVFTLQALLGHRGLLVIEHYLKLATTDVEKAHQRASPGDNWKK